MTESALSKADFVFGHMYVDPEFFRMWAVLQAHLARPSDKPMGDTDDYLQFLEGEGVTVPRSADDALAQCETQVEFWDQIIECINSHLDDLYHREGGLKQIATSAWESHQNSQ